MSDSPKYGGSIDYYIFLLAGLFVILTIAFAACNKDTNIDAPPPFPAATQTGANTMAAIVNGNQFIVYTLPGSVTQSLIVGYDYEQFSLFGIDPSKEFQGNISINISYLNGPGTYKLINQNGFPGNSWGQLEFVTPSGQGAKGQTDSVNTGTVTITRFDVVNHIISGTFSMKPALASGTITTVQSGRFDVTYIPPH